VIASAKIAPPLAPTSAPRVQPCITRHEYSGDDPVTTLWKRALRIMSGALRKSFDCWRQNDDIAARSESGRLCGLRSSHLEATNCARNRAVLRWRVKVQTDPPPPPPDVQGSRAEKRGASKATKRKAAKKR